MNPKDMKFMLLVEHTLLWVGISQKLNMKIKKEISKELFKTKVDLRLKESNHLSQPPLCDEKTQL